MLGTVYGSVDEPVEKLVCPLEAAHDFYDRLHAKENEGYWKHTANIRYDCRCYGVESHNHARWDCPTKFNDWNCGEKHQFEVFYQYLKQIHEINPLFKNFRLVWLAVQPIITNTYSEDNVKWKTVTVLSFFEYFVLKLF